MCVASTMINSIEPPDAEQIDLVFELWTGVKRSGGRQQEFVGVQEQYPVSAGTAGQFPFALGPMLVTGFLLPRQWFHTQ